MPGLPIVFFILAAVAIATAVGTILSRNAIYSALLLVLNFATIAVLYLILNAPFIALSQITVYAGSIMVLFLFVIMLLGAERLPSSDALRWQPFVVVPLAAVLIGVFTYNIFARAGAPSAAATVPQTFGAPQAVGKVLFTQYMLPFEMTAVVLFVAVVGAIMLAKPDRPAPRPKPGAYGRQVIEAPKPAVTASPETVETSEAAAAPAAVAGVDTETEKVP